MPRALISVIGAHSTSVPRAATLPTGDTLTPYGGSDIFLMTLDLPAYLPPDGGNPTDPIVVG